MDADFEVPILKVHESRGEKMKKAALFLLLAGGVVYGVVASSSRYSFHVEADSQEYSNTQEQLLIEHEKTTEASVRARNAYVLSNLWKDGKLRPEIKDYLVDKYYKLVLLQVGHSWPAFTVQCQQSFPFPDNYVQFTPRMYRNGEVVRFPEHSEKGHALSINSSIITSWAGGSFDNNDMVFYEIKIEEIMEEKAVWERLLRTNEVLVRGLKDRVE
ncbi:MAG TPA: hypothetical protein VMX13_01555 [Sedimentisphaerales bacterium]|nr:hypothetical protein [Sedimentisphaerales bacterium]